VHVCGFRTRVTRPVHISPPLAGTSMAV